MWTCSRCNRVFQKQNQSHICVIKDVGELFLDKPDHLVLAWDKLNALVMEWQPNVYSAATKSIVYTSKKAWLIIKPMKAQLDVKFYTDQYIEHPRIARHSAFGKKHAHHIRIKNEHQVDEEVLELLKIGFDFSIMDP